MNIFQKLFILKARDNWEIDQRLNNGKETNIKEILKLRKEIEELEEEASKILNKNIKEWEGE